jgi:hypothetical protein
MRIVAIASYKKGVRCVAFSTMNLQNFAVDLSLFSSTISASMAGNSDSEIKNSYSDDLAVKARRDNQVELGTVVAIMR